MSLSDTAPELNDRLNSIFGCGLLWACLVPTEKMTVELVSDADGQVTGALLVKFPFLDGESAERGYLVTVSIPPVAEP